MLIYACASLLEHVQYVRPRGVSHTKYEQPSPVHTARGVCLRLCVCLLKNAISVRWPRKRAKPYSKPSHYLIGRQPHSHTCTPGNGWRSKSNVCVCVCGPPCVMWHTVCLGDRAGRVPALARTGWHFAPVCTLCTAWNSLACQPHLERRLHARCVYFRNPSLDKRQRTWPGRWVRSCVRLTCVIHIFTVFI